LAAGGSEFYDQCEDPSAWPQAEQLLQEEEEDDLFYYNSRPHSQLKQYRRLKNELLIDHST